MKHMKKHYEEPTAAFIILGDEHLMDTIQQSTGSGGTIDDGGRLDAPRRERDHEEDPTTAHSDFSLWD